MSKIYKSIRKSTAPPTKEFKNNKDKLKNESILLEVEEYLDEFELDKIKYKETIQKIKDKHIAED